MLVLRNKELFDEAEALTVDLGVDFDRNLSYENAVHNTYIKANKKLFTLRKIQPYITQRVSVLVYKQFIPPILDYADVFFDSTVK